MKMKLFRRLIVCPPLFGAISLAIYCRVAPLGFQAGSAPF